MTAAAVISGDMTLGMMLAVQYIIGQLNAPIDQLVQFLYSLQNVRISMERIQEISSQEEEENCNRTIVTSREMNSDIIFDNVSFKYDRHSSRHTLSDISTTIQAGKITAIVGSSGSGKTTLLKLILGYYPHLSGSLTIGSHPMECINQLRPGRE